jgi:hypothetical protein
MKIKEIKNKILIAIERFNEIRRPEAVAELIELKGNNFLIKFSGHMCFTCGTYDYFEDLMYELCDLGVETKIKEFQNFGDYFLVRYEIKTQKEQILMTSKH